MHMKKHLSSHVKSHYVVPDIGAHANFEILSNLNVKSRCIIDPYNGSGGAGLSKIPELPYPISLYRCAIGVDSSIIPDHTFDLTFSISVLEHIGQAESNYDCQPANPPPSAQEAKRDLFCRELFRITKKGGLTLHTIDHAARNISFFDNFTKASFQVLPSCNQPSTNQALDDKDAVRQKCGWLGERMMGDQEQRLHSVLFLACIKP